MNLEKAKKCPTEEIEIMEGVNIAYWTCIYQN